MGTFLRMSVHGLSVQCPVLGGRAAGLICAWAGWLLSLGSLSSHFCNVSLRSAGHDLVPPPLVEQVCWHVTGAQPSGSGQTPLVLLEPLTREVMGWRKVRDDLLF